ncbi:MAG: hypothetical protein AMJ88_18840 [Anaerolineae bacterium SM23_ 63]|nr:MAG: hypothetical protein AMJ88_18840 [Anaerolineae bacterium SM23_ 63]
MKRELIPYYVSRAILSVLLGLLISSGKGIWVGVLCGLVVYVGFLWYAHNGRYLIDTTNPLFPLRRDARGVVIRDRAIGLSVAVGGLAYLGLSLASNAFPIKAHVGSWALFAGVAAYFVISNWLFMKQ